MSQQGSIADVASVRAITQEPDAAHGTVTMGTLDALWCIALNAKDLIIRPTQAISEPILVKNVIRARTTLFLAAFFLSGSQSPVFWSSSNGTAATAWQLE